jgi:hypothetical protein
LSTPRDQILAHAQKTIVTRDTLNRDILLRQITALDRLRLLKAAGPELSQNQSWLSMATLVMSVLEINGTPKVTPANERQIEALVAELGDAGLQAVSDGLANLDNETLLFDAVPEGNVEGTPS